jgi:hypothetical protein
MVPQLAQVADDYSVPVYSSGRFDSVTEKYDFAREIGAAARLEINGRGTGFVCPSGVGTASPVRLSGRARRGGLSPEPETRLPKRLRCARHRCGSQPRAPARVPCGRCSGARCCATRGAGHRRHWAQRSIRSKKAAADVVRVRPAALRMA